MKKKIYVCPNCGRALNFSENTEFTFYCVDCGENFHDYEVEAEEQARIEGIKDYTELVEAAMEIKAITDKAIQATNKQIEIKGNDIVKQVSEYIYETIQPILDSGIYSEYKFRDSARIYTSNLRLYFGVYLTEIGECQAQLFGHNGNLRVYFKQGSGYYIETAVCLTKLVKEWSKLKDSMHRMIPYAIEKCNNANQKRIEEQQAISEIINSFRL